MKNIIEEENIPCSKTVFQLRREGNLDDALNIGRVCYENNKEDVRTAKSLAWVLYDLIKKAKEKNETEKANEYLKELLSINVEDDLLTQKKEYLVNELNPDRDIVRKAKIAYEQQNYKEALNLYRQAIQIFPEDEQVNISMGWCLSKVLKELVPIQNPDTALIRKVLIEYSKLRFNKPNILHSKILEYMLNISSVYPKFIEFVKWWDINLFSYEDFIGKDVLIGKDDLQKKVYYPSLAEKTAREISKLIVDKVLINEVDFAISFIDKVLQETETPYHFWLKYYKGKLLIISQKYDEAREYILPIVRSKKNEAWAWNILGSSFIEQDIEKSIACLCKSLSLSQVDDFTLNVRIELAELLLKVNDFDSAKYEIDRVINFRKSHNYRINDNLNAIINQNWYINANIKQDNTDLYKNYSLLADDLYTENLEWKNSILTSKSADGRFFIYINENNSGIEMLVRIRDFPLLDELEIGCPIQVKIDKNTGREIVVKIEKRDGYLWDLLDFIPAIIEHNNIDKGVSYVIFGIREATVVYHDKFPVLKGLDAGTTIQIKLIKFKDKDNSIKCKICEIINSDKNFNTNFIEKNTRKISIPYEKNFGFLDGIIYVPPYLIEKNELKNGNSIKYIAALARKSKNSSEWKWKVLNIFEVTSREYENND